MFAETFQKGRPHHEEIFKERDRKLEEARELRRKKRQPPVSK